MKQLLKFQFRTNDFDNSFIYPIHVINKGDDGNSVIKACSLRQLLKFQFRTNDFEELFYLPYPCHQQVNEGILTLP